MTSPTNGWFIVPLSIAQACRGSLRAALAIAYKILVAVFHMLAKTIPFQELGEASSINRHPSAPRPTSSGASTTLDTTSSSGQRSPHDRPPSSRPTPATNFRDSH